MPAHDTTTGTDTQTQAVLALCKGVSAIYGILNHPAFQAPADLALMACRRLVTAYAQGEECGGCVECSELDEVYSTAARALRLPQQQA